MTPILHLPNAYTRLRHRLHLHLGVSPAEISVPLPAGTNDELSFYRLVIWGYVVIQETAKVHISFLKELPPLSTSDPALPQLSILRTWIGHNLDLSKTSDEKKLRAAQLWLRQACGSSSPSSPAHWGKCCDMLSLQIAEVIDGAVAACDAFDSPEDGARLVGQLIDRLNRTWEAFRFDNYVADAIERLGYCGLSVVEIRKKYLDAWRKVIALSEPAEWDRLLRLRIEMDLLKLMHAALPFTTQEVLNILSCKNTPELAATMLVLKSTAESGNVEIAELLNLIIQHNPSHPKPNDNIENETCSST